MKKKKLSAAILNALFEFFPPIFHLQEKQDNGFKSVFFNT